MCNIFSFFWQLFKALVNVHGTVVCKDKCGPSVSVTLMRLADKHNKERQTVSLTDGSSEFLFSDIIPGKYILEVCCLFYTSIFSLDLLYINLALLLSTLLSTWHNIVIKVIVYADVLKLPILCFLASLVVDGWRSCSSHYVVISLYASLCRWIFVPSCMLVN